MAREVVAGEERDARLRPHGLDCDDEIRVLEGDPGGGARGAGGLEERLRERPLLGQYQEKKMVHRRHASCALTTRPDMRSQCC